MELALTVLGSGGPIANAHRASSGYLVAIDGVPRILVDAGGGVYERVGKAGIDLSGLELVLLTHTHVDHTGGLAPIVFHTYMMDRNRPLAIVGPAGRDMHPGCARFTELLFGTAGAWSYLHTFDGFAIEASEMPSDHERPIVRDVGVTNDVLARLGVTVRSVAVPHGMMPSVAYRITCGERSIAFSGDVQNASPALASLARDVDLLVHDLALPERDVPHGNLHAKPSAVGTVARDATARALLVSHFMPQIEPELPSALRIVRDVYSGPVFVAEDLASYDVGLAVVRQHDDDAM
ncbi:MAG: MBL fold metallo-hydrolase [Vulcanimicrobiaceae bacterium]